MKQIFSEHGILQVVRWDNRPDYDSQNFKDFAQQCGFIHVTSSPHYPRSNGFIEAHVKTVKNTLKKARAMQSDPYIALMSLRRTPITNKLPPPAELLLGRSIQDNLLRKILRNYASDEVTDRLEHRQDVQKHFYDRGCKPLPSLLPGQQVRVQNPTSHKWTPAVIKEELQDFPRSYKVTTPAGAELRRNRQHIREALHTCNKPATEPSLQTTSPQSSASKSKQEEQVKPQVVTRSGREVKPPQKYGF